MMPKASLGVIRNTRTKIGVIVDSSKAFSIEVLVFSIFASIPSIAVISPFDINEEPGILGNSWKS